MRKLLSLETALERLSIGKTTLYKQIKEGALGAVHVGRRTFIEEAELERYLSALPKHGAPSAAQTRPTQANGIQLRKAPRRHIAAQTSLSRPQRTVATEEFDGLWELIRCKNVWKRPSPALKENE